MTMLIVGILAVVALPKMVDVDMWRLKAFGDELRAQTLAMERLAAVQRRTIIATVTPTGVAFAYASGPAIVAVNCPSTIATCIAESATRTVSFNAALSGSATTSTGSSIPVTVAYGAYSQAYQIEAETGLMYATP